MQHFIKLFVLFTFVALFSGCGSAPKQTDRSDIVSDEFRSSLGSALRYDDPDRRLDAVTAIPTQSQAEVLMKNQAMARVALTHKTDAFATTSEPLINTVNRKGYHETTDEMQALARLGGIATDRRVDVTRRVAAAVDKACARRSIANRTLDATEREKGDNYIAEACFYLLKNNPNQAANSELRALALYENAAIEELLPAYITTAPAASTPYLIQVLQGRLCDTLGVFCEAISANSFVPSQ